MAGFAFSGCAGCAVSVSSPGIYHTNTLRIYITQQLSLSVISFPTVQQAEQNKGFSAGLIVQPAINSPIQGQFEFHHSEREELNILNVQHVIYTGFCMYLYMK